MSPSPPRVIALRSSSTSNCVLHCTDRNGYRNILLCNKDDMGSPHAKFILERVDPENNLFNIRCCFNNKYWVVGSENFVEAREKKAGEATLFKLEPVDAEKNTYRLKCMKIRRYVCLSFPYLVRETVPSLKVESETHRQDSFDVFTVVAWDSLVILPKDVAFKADNGNYICVNDGELTNVHYFLEASTTDIGGKTVANEIVTLSDQKIAIKNNYTSQFWTYEDINYKYGNPNIYLIAASNDNSKRDSQFLPIKINRNFIALRNVDYGSYCIRRGSLFVLSDDWNATIRKEAELQVEELVVSRKVYDVEFRLDDSFIYNENMVDKGSAETINGDNEEKKIKG